MQKLSVIILTFLAFGIFISCKTQIPQTKQEQLVAKKNPDTLTSVDNTIYFIDGVKEANLGNTTKAVNLFRKCVELDPNDAAARYELAKLYSQTGNIPDAIDEAKAAVDIDPANDWYKLLLARLYTINGEYAKNVEVLEDLCETSPQNMEYLLELAASYMLIGEQNNAVKTYDKIEELVGIDENIILQKHSIYKKMGKTDEAVAEINKLIATFPNEGRYYSMLAETHLSSGNEEKALEAYKKVAEINPEDPYIHISLSDYYRNKGDKEKAYEELKLGFSNPALEIDTKVQILLAYYTVNQLYSDLKDEAFELADILIVAHPDDPKSYSIQADLLYQQDEFEKARDAFRKVLSIDSSKYVVWEQLLFIESEIADYKAMQIESQRALELFPQQPLFYLFAAMSNYQLKNYQEVVTFLERGITFIVENNQLLEQFYAYLGDAYNQLHDNEQSDACYEKALNINPSNSIVLNNYAYYLSLRGENLEKAEQMAAKAVQIDSVNSANMDTYGWVLYKIEKYKEAKEWVWKAINHGGESNPTLLEHYGDILYKLGDKTGAIKYWEKAREAGKGSDLLDKKLQDKQLYE